MQGVQEKITTAITISLNNGDGGVIDGCQPLSHTPELPRANPDGVDPAVMVRVV